MKIFVYGTLKKGYGNNIILKSAKFIEEAIVKGYKLFYAGFPVASPDPDSAIKGEIWEIDPKGETLNWLDRLEGNGRMYNREVSNDISLYVGHPGYWRFDSMKECPNNNGVYYWDKY